MKTRSQDVVETSDESLFKIVHVSKKGATGRDVGIQNVFLFGKNTAVLQEKCNLLKQYTTKVDPKVPLPAAEIKENQLADPKAKSQHEYIIEPTNGVRRKYRQRPHVVLPSELAAQGYHYYVDVIDLLPRPVKALYGSHSINQHKGCCYKAARIAGGIFPAMLENYPLYRYFPHAEPKQVSLQELAPGDMIVLPNHHFVFLDHDLSISMNGVGNPFCIYPTDEILQFYGQPVDALKLHQPNLNMKIFRKQEDWYYPEEMMPSLMEYYDIASSYYDYTYSAGEAFPRIQEIAALLRKFCDKYHSREEDAWKSLYSNLKGDISILEEYEEDDKMMVRENNNDLQESILRRHQRSGRSSQARFFSPQVEPTDIFIEESVKNLFNSSR